MKEVMESFMQLLGRAPSKPTKEEITPPRSGDPFPEA